MTLDVVPSPGPAGPCGPVEPTIPDACCVTPNVGIYPRVTL